MSQVDNAKIIEKIPFFRGLSHHQVLKAYGMLMIGHIRPSQDRPNRAIRGSA